MMHNSAMQTFIVISDFNEPPEVIAEHLDDHRAWMRRQYDSGCFLLSGKRQTADGATGGAAVARASDEAEMLEILAGDPFAQKGITTAVVHRLEPSAPPNRHPAFEEFISA